MRVQAAPGIKVPKEHDPRAHITEDAAVEVPEDSAYYQRRVSDGDLVVIADQPKKGK